MTIPRKILVVEDSPTTRRQITDILETAGYQVISAEDGEAALELVCLLYTSPSPRDATLSRMPSSA